MRKFPQWGRMHGYWRTIGRLNRFYLQSESHSSQKKSIKLKESTRRPDGNRVVCAFTLVLGFVMSYVLERLRSLFQAAMTMALLQVLKILKLRTNKTTIKFRHQIGIKSPTLNVTCQSNQKQASGRSQCLHHNWFVYEMSLR